MKLYIILTIFLTIFSALVPFTASVNTKSPTNQVSANPASEIAAETETESTENKNEMPSSIKVLRTGSGKIVEKELFDYVKGSVAAEMPPTYEKEALKAQAVACYTYALWLRENSDSSSLGGADVSDSPANYQGFLDDDELKDKWGENYSEYMSAVTNAVSEVFGEYLQYDGKPVMACYHAISTGRTESAKNAWGSDVPYLQGVRAPGDILSPDVDSTVEITDEQFKEYAKGLDGVSLPKSSKKWVGKTEAAKSGYVTKITIGSKTFSGSDVRSAFALKSPAFTVEKTDKGFRFLVKGYGHLVGMSQYSADYMARQGSGYKDILLHFFKGAKLA